LGYYTLAATSVALISLPDRLAKRLPCYPVLPATLMGRLAVDQRHRGRKLGELLLFDAFSRALRSEIATYAFIVDTKDDAATAFYARYRFLPLTQGSRRLFVPMAEIAKLCV
jgi:predicted GNAT family N-acyltransferase